MPVEEGANLSSQTKNDPVTKEQVYCDLTPRTMLIYRNIWTSIMAKSSVWPNMRTILMTGSLLASIMSHTGHIGKCFGTSLTMEEELQEEWVKG